MQSATRSARRSLIRRVTALDTVIDEAVGESSEIRYHSGVLQDALDGLFAALAGWNIVANHLEQLPGDIGRQDAAAVLECIPSELQSALAAGDADAWIAGASKLRELSQTAAQALVALPASTPSLRLLADRAASALGFLSHALNGLALLNDPAGALQWSHHKKLRIPDLLPALVNALRVFLTIAAVSLFWIVTAWPSGALAVTFAAVGAILLSPRGDLAQATGIRFLLGVVLATVLAAIVKFALLPKLETFTGFSIAMGLVLVPLGALLAQPWQTGVFLAAGFGFIAIMAPTNEMTYSTIDFYNSSLAILAGTGAAVLAIVLLPQLPPARQARRRRALSLRDFRRLAVKPTLPTVDDWIGLVAGGLEALPPQAEPVQFARLVTVLSAGAEIIRLRHLASESGFSAEFDPALNTIAHGQSQVAIELMARAAGP